MRFGRLLAVLAAGMILGLCGCGEGKKPEEKTVPLPQSFETTARVKYQGLETILTVYKKPMNCATVSFESPASLRDMRMTFYTDKVTLGYQDLTFDFAPEKLPGKAAAAMLLSAVNTALREEGIEVTQDGDKLELKGTIEEGGFILTVDSKNGNVLRLSIPEQALEVEVLNFKILEDAGR